MDAFVELLCAGRVVACPTETQMGLLANALDVAAVQAVADLKGRPKGEPIGLLVPSLEVARELSAEFSPLALKLARKHWPGPLSLVVRAAAGLCPELQRDGKVALRMPGASPALQLVRAFGGALTATSANLSGMPPARDAAEIRDMFGAALVVVPGEVPGGPPSTMLDVSGERAIVLRAGAVVVDC